MSMIQVENAYDGLSLDQQRVVLALGIVLERIKSLAAADRGDLFELLQALPAAEDEEGRDAIWRTVEEILTQRNYRADVMPSTVGEESLNDEAAELSRRLGKTIRGLRGRASMSQEQLAERAGLVPSLISRLESGEHCPTHKTLAKIAEALEVDVRAIDPDHD